VRAIAAAVIAVILVSACAAPAPSTSAPTTALVGSAAQASPSAADPWTEDLDQLDREVRAFHPNPFQINPESAWVAQLAKIRSTIATASKDEQLVQLASLVGLLDTHSGVGPPTPLQAYELLLYPFSDGWYVIRAKDPSLVGDRLESIGGKDVAAIEATLRPLVPADNESGELDGLQGLFSYAAFLHGAGIVDDRAKPEYVLDPPTGENITVDPSAVDANAWEDELGIVGDLVGDAPTAVARRIKPVWTQLDKKRKTFLISYNDYTENDLQPAIEAMRAALDAKSAERVVLDMRYLRGGNGSLAGPLIDALTGDPRVSRKGGLVVLIGRENVSAGTVVAGAIDRGTDAIFVGEETPARADNFLCDCRDITLTNSGYVVTVPTITLRNGDTRDSIPPDVPMKLASAEFFAGKDPVLDAVMDDRLP
jgi:hypothetical protein